MNGTQLFQSRAPAGSVQVGSPLSRLAAAYRPILGSETPELFDASKEVTLRPASVRVDPGHTPVSAIGLLNSKQLAYALGVSPWVLKGIKRAGAAAGDSPFVGRYSTLRKIQAWLDRNPQFVASHHLRNRSP